MGLSEKAVGVPGEPAWGDVSVLLSAWYRRARESQMSHYAAAAHYAVVNRWLGVPTIVFSAAAGSTLLATAQDRSPTALVQFAAGLVAFAAGALSAMQTFLRPSERADKHLAAGAAYGTVRRKIEHLQVLGPAANEDLRSVLDAIRARLDEAASMAPNVGARTWRGAQADIAHTSRPEGFTRDYLDARRSAG